LSGNTVEIGEACSTKKPGDIMRLRNSADIRTLLFVGLYFAVTVVAWVTFGTVHLGWSVLLLALTCVLSFLGAVATHNTVHCPVFRERWANRVFQVVLSLTYGSPVSSFVPGHNLSHHKHTQSPRDVMRTTKVRHNSNLLNMLEFVPRVALAIMKNDKVYMEAMRGTHRAWYRQFRIEQTVVFGVTAVLFLLDWQKTLLYWIVPHLYAAWGIIGMNYLQHDGCDIEHPYNHSRNFVGKWVNFITYNNGYHGIHHRIPGAHWSLLPKLHAEKIAPYIDPRLDVPSFPVYLFQTFVWPGTRQMYDGSPVILPPEQPDENWIPRPEETPEDLGAMAPTGPGVVEAEARLYA
jgi:fatty acid desaturase